MKRGRPFAGPLTTSHRRSSIVLILWFRQKGSLLWSRYLEHWCHCVCFTFWEATLRNEWSQIDLWEDKSLWLCISKVQCLRFCQGFHWEDACVEPSRKGNDQRTPLARFFNCGRYTSISTFIGLSLSSQQNFSLASKEWSSSFSLKKTRRRWSHTKLSDFKIVFTQAESYYCNR